jgi:hypothetical protein
MAAAGSIVEDVDEFNEVSGDDDDDDDVVVEDETTVLA